jgi:hypothetical protein
MTAQEQDPLPAPAGAERWRRGLHQLRELVARPWRRGRSLLEIRGSVVDRVSARATYVGSGRRVFPYNDVVVVLYPRDERERAEMAAAVGAGWADQVRAAVIDRLDELGCDPDDLRVSAEVAEGEPAPASDSEQRVTPEPFDLRFSTVERKVAAAPRQPRLQLRVARGRAEQDHYAFEQERVYIGRMPEVIDEHGRVKRRNHVAFLDEGEENQTVSREQARIVYRDDSAGYWLLDERSAHGTRIFRGGRPIDVSSRDRRGIRLQDGDEIYFGQAAVVCSLLAPEPL